MAPTSAHHTSLTLSVVAALCDVSVQALRTTWLRHIPEAAIDKSGRTPRYMPAAVSAIWRERMRQAEVRRPVGEDSVADAESPALEHKRWAEAQIKWLELGEKKKRLLDREKLEAEWNAGAIALRNTAEKLQRRFGPEAVDMYNEGVEEFTRRVSEAARSHADDVDVTEDVVGPERPRGGVVPPRRDAAGPPPPVVGKVRGGRARRSDRPVRGNKVSS